MDGASFRFDGFEFDTVRYELRSGAEHISLEPRAFDVLGYLIANRDRVVSKEELLDSVWGDRFVSEAALTTALRTARKAIDDSGKEQRLIRTVLRRGYQFVGTVTEESVSPTAEIGNRFPLPTRLAQSSGVGFAGRHDEFAILKDACKEVVATGQRQLVLVSGEAGIGKTTLCSMLAAHAHRDGAAVLYGRCDDELSVPYQPWREMLAGLDRELPEALENRRDALAPLLSGAPAVDSDSSSDSARFALYSAVVDVLDAVSGAHDLTVIVLDDLHWADAQTVALLRHFAQRSMPANVLVIATFRDTDIDASHTLTALLAAAHREPGTTRLALDGLGGGDIVALLEAVAGHEMDADGEALCGALQAETEGNPFFVTEILRHLTESGAVTQNAEGRWTAPADLQSHGLPISVREVVSRRIERLGRDTRRALDTASVIGRDFDLELLAALLDETPARTFESLAPAIENSVISDAGGRFAFAHAIVAHTLYEELSPTARALSHEAAAVAIERVARPGVDERVGEIAHHLVRSIGAANRTKAAEFTRRAGDDAIARLAPEEAVTWYRQCLDLIGDDDAARRGVVLVGLGTAQRQAGDPRHRETLLGAARLAIELGDDDLLVRAALANNRGEISQFGAVDHERIQTLRRAIAVRPDGPDAALLNAVLSIEMSDEGDEVVQPIAAHALELARAVGDDRITARVVRLAESALCTPDGLGRRHEWLQEGLAAAERTGDEMLLGMLAMSHHEIAVEQGDRDAMDTARAARHAFAERSPEPFIRWTNEQTNVTHLFLDGDLDASEAAAAVALDIGLASGQPEALDGYAGQLFQLRRAQGRLAEVVDEFEQVLAENPSTHVFRAGMALVYCELGREPEARELMTELDLSRGEAPQFWSTTLMLAASVCHRLTLPDMASRLVDILHPWRGQVASTGATTEGAIAHGLGLALATTGRVDDAMAAFDLAVDVNGRLRAPLFVARTHLARAELLAESDAEAARTIATGALSEIDAFAFDGVKRHLGSLIARLR